MRVSLANHLYEVFTAQCFFLILLLLIDCFLRTIGPRSKVWSEKENVDEGAYEFAEVCNVSELFC